MPNETTSHKGTSAGFAEDSEVLKREVRSLKDQRDLLRSALAAVRTHNNILQATLAEVSLQNRTIAEDIDKCLGKEDTISAHGEPSPSRHSSASGRDTPKFSTSNIPRASGNAAESVVSPKQANQPGKVPSVLRDAATIGRAVSPGPAELGFSVEPSSSSPEDLIRALGPLPTAGPQSSIKPDHWTLNSSPSTSSAKASTRDERPTSHLPQATNNALTDPKSQSQRPHCGNTPPQEQVQVAKPNLSTEAYNHPNVWHQSTRSPPRDTSSTFHYSQDATRRPSGGGSVHFQPSSNGSHSGFPAPEASPSTYGRDLTRTPTSDPRSDTYAPAFRHWPPPPPPPPQQSQRVDMPPPPRPI